MSKQTFVYWMIFPSIIFLVLMTIFPVFYTIFYSFTDYYYLSTSAKNFIGFKNYFQALTDASFLTSVWVTMKFMFLAVFFETLFGLVLALFLNYYQTRRASAIRTIFLLPSLLPPVTVALMWQMMLSNRDGIINQAIEFIGLAKVHWLVDPAIALYSILLIDIWQWTPFAFLLLYATLQTIPKEQYEASRLDGANSWQNFFYIVLPNIAQGIFLVILLRTIDTFRLFDKVNILTKGGPANSTSTITQYIYENGIENLQIGLSSAVTILMILLVVLFSSGSLFKLLQFGKQKS